VQEQKLLPDDGASGEQFGDSVSVSGDVAVVGANRDDDNGSSSGSAYVFRWNGTTWAEEQKLLPADGATGDRFGVSVSVSGGVAVVGAYGDDDNGSLSGSAYVFPLSVPTESYPPDGLIDARQPSDAECNEPFGWDSIALSYNHGTAFVAASDFEVTVEPGDVPPPGIVKLVPDGDTATLQFTDPAPPGHWTIVTHQPSGFSTRVGALPGDVNGDGMSGSRDILALIDFLNGIGLDLDLWQTDIDRSGKTNTADIIRLIDLLQGSGCFDPWMQQSLPE
jgi:hypothetical protein